MITGGPEPHWSKNPLYKKPTRQQMLDAIAQYKSESVTVEHNCYIRPNNQQPNDMKGVRGHCTRCGRLWIRKYIRGRLSLGWEPL